MEESFDFIGIAVVYFCHDGEGNFVMSKRNENCRDEVGRWDPGGGAIHLGETAEKALRREIKEEYGTPMLSYEFLGFRDISRILKGRKAQWITLDFKVLVDSKRVKNGEPHKFDEVKWFRLENLPKPLHSKFPDFIKKYSAKLAH